MDVLAYVPPASSGRTPLNVLVGSVSVPLLAAFAGMGLVRLANGRPERLAGAHAVRSARWALLLPAVVVMTGDLLGLDLWQSASPGVGIGPAVVAYLVGLALLAAVVVGLTRWPRAAADLAALGLVGIGAHNVIQSGFGRYLVVVHKVGSPADRRRPSPSRWLTMRRSSAGSRGRCCWPWGSGCCH